MNEPRGFGGWLIVALIECAVTAAISAFDLLATLHDHAGWAAPGRGLELFIDAVSVALNVAAGALVVAERPLFPAIFVLALVWRVIRNAFDAFGSDDTIQTVSTNATALVTALAVALVWVLYLMKSARVRNTFPPLRANASGNPP